MGHNTGYTPGQYSRGHPLSSGVNIEIHDGDNLIRAEDLEVWNKESNQVGIFVDNFDMLEVGGKGGGEIGEIAPEVVEAAKILTIIIGPIAVNILSNFAYDKLKSWVLRIIKNKRNTKGKHIVEIRHFTKRVIFVHDPEENADIIFEESFDTLFRDVELNETDNPDYIDEAILRRYAKG